MELLGPDQILPRRATSAIALTLALTAGLPLVSSLTWRASTEFHSVLEVIATQLALTTAGIALVRYYAKRSSMFLLIGAGFLGAGVLDGYHALITSAYMAGRTPSAFSALTHWSGAVSRVFLSILLIATLVVQKRWPIAGRAAERMVFLLACISHE